MKRVNEAVEYRQQGRRAYALIYDSDGDKIWRSRSPLPNFLPEKNYAFENFDNMDSFIKHVEEDDKFWIR